MSRPAADARPQEIHLRDLDGLGEIRVTVWRTGDAVAFRFAIHDDDGGGEPRETFDISAEDAVRLAMGIAGTVIRAAGEQP